MRHERDCSQVRILFTHQQWSERVALVLHPIHLRLREDSQLTAAAIPDNLTLARCISTTLEALQWVQDVGLERTAGLHYQVVGILRVFPKALIAPPEVGVELLGGPVIGISIVQESRPDDGARQPSAVSDPSSMLRRVAQAGVLLAEGSSGSGCEISIDPN